MLPTQSTSCSASYASHFEQLQRTHWPGDDTNVISFDPEACSPLCKQGQLCQPHALLQSKLT